MSIYANIKSAVSVPEAARHYGLTVNRSGMVRCPFHPDHTPSLKLNEDYYYCFGCHKSGDVIDFVAELLRINRAQAAERISADFGIDLSSARTEQNETSSLPEYPLVREFRKEEVFCVRVRSDYEQLLEYWKETCAPKAPGDSLDDRFVENCRMLPTVRYLLDLLTAADFQARHAIVEQLKENDTLQNIASYVAEKREGTHGSNRDHEQLCA